MDQYKLRFFRDEVEKLAMSNKAKYGLTALGGAIAYKAGDTAVKDAVRGRKMRLMQKEQREAQRAAARYGGM